MRFTGIEVLDARTLEIMRISSALSRFLRERRSEGDELAAAAHVTMDEILHDLEQLSEEDRAVNRALLNLVSYAFLAGESNQRK